MNAEWAVDICTRAVHLSHKEGINLYDALTYLGARNPNSTYQTAYKAGFRARDVRGKPCPKFPDDKVLEILAILAKEPKLNLLEAAQRVGVSTSSRQGLYAALRRNKTPASLIPGRIRGYRYTAAARSNNEALEAIGSDHIRIHSFVGSKILLLIRGAGPYTLRQMRRIAAGSEP